VTQANERFIAQFPRQLASLDLAIRSQAIGTWHIAHLLKRSAADVGAWELVELCGAAEYAARARAFERASAVVRTLPDAFVAACETLGGEIAA
jgi:HPt (histidine-containing phosphotransfer) domain-containing protein